MAQRPSAPPVPLLHLRDIVGQAPAVERLRKAIELSRLPHALLFWGPAGVGKQATAKALAAAMLCSGRSTAANGAAAAPAPNAHPVDACGHCEDCRMVEAGTHPDFNLVYKELAAFHEDSSVRDRVMQALSIDVVRSFLIAPAASAPSRGRAKIFVVLDAELMSDDAQNSLLKTLEEPPSRVTIILMAERPEELLATTRSRCSLVRFDPLPAEFVARKLREAGIEEAEARFWAGLTGGSAGEALRLAKEDLGTATVKEGLYQVKRKLLADIAVLGQGESGLAETLGKITEGLAESAIRRAKAATGAEMSKTLATRQGVAVVLQILASAAGDAMAVRCAERQGTNPPPLVHADQTAEIQAFAHRFTPDQLAEILEQLAEFERLLWRNVNPKLLWDNAVITLSSAAPLRV
jgi:DNA polymerase III subunit delta'